MFDRLIAFFRNEAVLCIAFICACASTFAAPDASAIVQYIDWRVIVLLFCLMAAVEGMRASGVLSRLAQMLVAGNRTKRAVCIALIMLPFFSSMLVTNDVALLTFVPIALLALKAANWSNSIVRVVVLQAIAANLGGMVTPFGNPQNLFIFTVYELGAPDFFWTLAPFGLLAFVLLIGASVTFGAETASVDIKLDEKAIDYRRFILHAILFCASVLAVMRVIPYLAVLPVVAVSLFVFDRRVFARVDYALLATFACFFVFSGNMAHMPAMQAFLGQLMLGHPMLTSLFASQVISNVPAAVLLSGFTANWHSLLVGVDLGGLGTPIASLASLIAFKLYLHSDGARASVFMREFAIANVAVLVAMCFLYAVLFVF
ncbi:MAG: anion permease [Eggerthellaceae bacterium]|nr:anion permease [Eggerthellaceae bacterium]